MRTDKNVQIAVIILIVAITVIYIGDRILGLLNLSLRHMDFKYTEANKQRNWINFMTPLAKEVGQKYGLPWQALVVQTAIETGWGKSSLFQKHNNYAGIKDDGKEPFVLMATTECNVNGCYGTKSRFEVFPSKHDGLVSYAKFFHKYSRYKEALKYPNDPYRFVEELKKAGYATDPNYVSKLHGMLRTYFPTA